MIIHHLQKFIAYLTAFEFTNSSSHTTKSFKSVPNSNAATSSEARCHHASALLDCVTKDEAEDMFELTFEDPSAVLTRMRQVNDIIACKREGFFMFKDVQSISVDSEVVRQHIYLLSGSSNKLYRQGTKNVKDHKKANNLFVRSPKIRSVASSKWQRYV